MALPAWMKDHLPAPEPTHPEWMKDHLAPESDDTPVGISPCLCGGEGCATCGDTGVIYP